MFLRETNVYFRMGFSESNWGEERQRKSKLHSSSWSGWTSTMSCELIFLHYEDIFAILKQRLHFLMQAKGKDPFFWFIIFKKGDSIASEFYTFYSQNRFFDNKYQVSEIIFLSREWRNPTKRREIILFFCFRKVTNSRFSHWIIESLKYKCMEFLWNGKSLGLWDLYSKNKKNNLFFLHKRWEQ